MALNHGNTATAVSPGEGFVDLLNDEAGPAKLHSRAVRLPGAKRERQSKE